MHLLKRCNHCEIYSGADTEKCPQCGTSDWKPAVDSIETKPAAKVKSTTANTDR